MGVEEGRGEVGLNNGIAEGRLHVRRRSAGVEEGGGANGAALVGEGGDRWVWGHQWEVGN